MEKSFGSTGRALPRLGSHWSVVREEVTKMGHVSHTAHTESRLPTANVYRLS